jgi:hypothetical protein
MLEAKIAYVKLHRSLWTYNPRNTDENGDEWNFENFSWFSEDKRQELLWARFLESDLPEKGAQAKTCDDDDLDLGARMLDEIVVSDGVGRVSSRTYHELKLASSATISTSNGGNSSVDRI